MNRRKFLQVLAGGAAGVAVGSRFSSPLFSSAQASGAVVPGVTNSEIRVGMSAAFSGASAALGSDYYLGAQAAYAEANANGGIFGRAVRVVAVDDGYTPARTLDNTLQLVEQEDVFCLSNYVGTPTLVRALPMLKAFSGDDLVLVGNLTGAQTQREAPYLEQVYNIRASYRQEMAALVEQFWALGLRNFGVFYQIDAYGRSGTDGVARALAERGASISAEATYRRGATFDSDVSAAVNHLKDAGVEVVLATGSYQACGAFIRTARDSAWNVPISNLSFVGADTLLNLLQTAGAASGKDYTSNLVNSQVVPDYKDTSLPVVRRYRDLTDKWQPTLPTELQTETATPVKYSFVGLEGFVNAEVLLTGLRLAGAELSRSSFRVAMESMNDLDIGIGTPLTFTANDHQGLNNVYYTYVQDGVWTPLRDWAAALS